MTNPTQYNYGSDKIACVRSTIAMEPGTPGQPYVEVPANTVRKQSMLALGAIPAATVVDGGRVFTVDQGSATRAAGFLCTRGSLKTLETTTDGVTFSTVVNCVTTSPMAEWLVTYPTMILSCAIACGDQLFLTLVRGVVSDGNPQLVGFLADWNGSAWAWHASAVYQNIVAGMAICGFDADGNRIVLGEYPNGAYGWRSAWMSEDAGANWVAVWIDATSPKINRHVHGVSIDRNDPDVLWISCGDGKGSCIVRLDRPSAWNGIDPWDAIVMEAAAEQVFPIGSITVSDESEAGTILMDSATPKYAIVAGEWVNVAWSGGSRESVLVLTVSHTAGSGTQTQFTFSGGAGSNLPAAPVVCSVAAWQNLHGAQSSQGCVVNGRYYTGREGDGTDTMKRGSIWSMSGIVPYCGNRSHVTVPTYMNGAYGPFDYIYNRSAPAGGGFSVAAIRHFGGLFMAGFCLYANPSTSYPQGQGLYVSDDGDTWVAAWRDDTVWGIQHIAGICNGKIGVVLIDATGGYDFALIAVPSVKRINALIQEISLANKIDSDATTSPDSFEGSTADPDDNGWTHDGHVDVSGDNGGVMGYRSIRARLNAVDDYYVQEAYSPLFGANPGPANPGANYLSLLCHVKAGVDCPSYFGFRAATTDDRTGSGSECLGATNQWVHPGDRWARHHQTYDPGASTYNQRWFLQWMRSTSLAENKDGSVLQVDALMAAFHASRYFSYSMTPQPCGASGTRGNELVTVDVGDLGSAWTVMFDWWPMEAVENILSGAVPVFTIYDTANSKGIILRVKASDRTLEVYGGAGAGTGLLTFTGSATRWRHNDFVKIALTYTVAGGLRLHAWSPLAAEGFRHIAQTVSAALTMIATPDALRPGQNIAGNTGGYGRYANLRTWKSALNDADVEAWMALPDIDLTGGGAGLVGARFSDGGTPMREIARGSTDVTLYTLVADDSTGAAKVGLAASAVTCTLTRTRAAASAIAVVGLGSPASAHTGGGWIEVSTSAAPGRYRFDAPDAAFASGVGEVLFDFQADGSIVASSGFVIVGPIGEDVEKVRKLIANNRKIDANDGNKETVFDDDGVTGYAEITHSEPSTGVVKETVTLL